MSIRFLRSSHMITIHSYMDILNTKCLIIIASLTAKLFSMLDRIARVVLWQTKKIRPLQNGLARPSKIRVRRSADLLRLSGTMHYTTCCFVDDLPSERAEVYPSLPLGTKKKMERLKHLEADFERIQVIAAASVIEIQLLTRFVCSFVCSFVRSLVCLFVCLFAAPSTIDESRR